MAEQKWRSKAFSVMVVLVFIPTVAFGQTMPAACTYEDGLYECNYGSLNTFGNIPLSASLFTPIPQRIRMVNLPATLSSTIFDVDFANLSYSDYDQNYPATLELKCSHPVSGSPGSLTLSSGFLTNMDHIDDFKIINCHLNNIPAGVFSELVSLDRFTIENGSIVSMDAGMLNGVTITRVYDEYRPFPITTGEVAFRNTKLTGSLPSGLFSGQTDLYAVVLEGMDMTSLSSSVFSTNQNLRSISLGHNQLTEIPSGLFDGLSSLGEVRLYNTEVSCTCESLWFMAHAIDNYISLHGDVICNNGDYADSLALRYYMENCAPGALDNCDGIVMMGSCMHLVDILANIFSLLAFIIGWVVFVIVIQIRKQINPGPGGGARPRRPPPYPGRRGPVPTTKKGWD